MRVYGTAPFKNTNKKRGCPRDILAGVGGVEPPITESKSVALPLGDGSVYILLLLIIKKQAAKEFLQRLLVTHRRFELRTP